MVLGMMLRKRTRSQQKAQHISHLMSDAIPDTHSHSDAFVLEHKSNSFFNVLGFNRKDSESDSLSSPTSTLDLRVFSSFANPFKFQRSSNDWSQKTWDCSKVGLSIIGSLDDELEKMGKPPLRSESKSIIFGPQMRIQTQSFQIHFDSLETPSSQTKPPNFQKSSSDASGDSDSPLYQDSFGDIHSCSPDSGKSGSLLACSNSNSELLSSSSVFEKGMNPELSATELSSIPASIASISAIEIQRSEDYTCVKTRSPYPKVTHIFGDCILEWHNHELTNFCKNGERGIELAMGGDGFKKHTAYLSSDFLSFCHHCKKELAGEDIYIYRSATVCHSIFVHVPIHQVNCHFRELYMLMLCRGEKAFCSCSCRSEEISIEEEEEEEEDEDSEKTNCGDEFSQNGLFITI